MKASELLERLHSLDSDLRRARALRDQTDQEYPLDAPRPDTEDWQLQAAKAFYWYQGIQDQLQELRPLVAKFLGQRPSMWTPSEMITLVTEKLTQKPAKL